MYILDIETKGNLDLKDIYDQSIKVPKTYKKQETIDAYLAKAYGESQYKMAVKVNFAQITCIGLKKLGEEGKIYHDLEEVFKVIGNDVFITYNGKSFDVPIMIREGIRNGLDLPYARLREATKKYGSHGGHLDLSDFNGNEYVSLDLLSQVYLGEAKDTKGEEFFRTATQEAIEKHCIEDLQMTENLYNKFKPLYE